MFSGGYNGASALVTDNKEMKIVCFNFFWSLIFQALKAITSVNLSSTVII